MVMAGSSQAKMISNAGLLFSDQKRVEAIIQLLMTDKDTVTQIHLDCPGQDFSSSAKRLQRIASFGLLQSRKEGNSRRYQVVAAPKLVAALNALNTLGQLIR
jgi:hypothetical protein